MIKESSTGFYGARRNIGPKFYFPDYCLILFQFQDGAIYGKYPVINHFVMILWKYQAIFLWFGKVFFPQLTNDTPPQCGFAGFLLWHLQFSSIPLFLLFRIGGNRWFLFMDHRWSPGGLRFLLGFFSCPGSSLWYTGRTQKIIRSHVAGDDFWLYRIFSVYHR